MARKNRTFVFAAGGTGGHLFPALAVAEALRREEPDAQLVFVGTKDRIESNIVPEFGFTFRAIWISGFQRRRMVRNLLLPLKVVVSILQSFFLIRRFKPDAVIGTGSYVCAPVLLVASLMGIPTVLHESNSYPGIATRLLAGRMTVLFVAFEEVARWLPNIKHLEVVGTPTRASLGTPSREQGCQTFGLDHSRSVILITGGSLGAASINTVVLNGLEGLRAIGAQLIWQTGASDLDRVRRQTDGMEIGWVGAFIHTMAEAYAAADLIVARAGATTIAELKRVAKPAVLIPYPHAAEDHQTHNARALEKAGAAVMIRDLELPTRFLDTVGALVKDERRRSQMREAFRGMPGEDAATVVAKRTLQLIR